MEFDSIKIYFRSRTSIFARFSFSRTPIFATFSFLYVSSPCVRPHLIALVQIHVLVVSINITCFICLDVPLLKFNFSLKMYICIMMLHLGQITSKHTVSYNHFYSIFLHLFLLSILWCSVLLIQINIYTHIQLHVKRGCGLFERVVHMTTGVID
jgi:hypothetical protein